MAFEIENNILRRYIPENDETEVIIPDGVTEIGDYAFEYCKNLKSICIPKGVTKIGNGAFSGCENLKLVVIPEGVIEFGNYAFEYCKNLNSIFIPKSVAKIEEDVFYCCENLEYINVDEENSEYISLDGILFNKNKTKIIKYPAGRKVESYIVPDEVAEIGNSAFAGCENLKSAVISGSVTKIGYDAFCGCENLKSVVISEGVNIIGYGAFSWCENLKSIVIPGSVTEIGEFAFDCDFGCDLNTKIKITFCHNDVNVSIILTFVWNEKSDIYKFFHSPNINNFKAIKKAKYKYPFALLRFFGYGEQEYKYYIETNIVEIAKYIIAEENYKLINLVIENDFITKRNTDKIIELATDNGKTEMVEILNNLKAEKNW